ncbi:MAG: hypothetical protein EOP18_07710, partial [Rhizobiaceae bacterium]
MDSRILETFKDRLIETGPHKTQASSDQWKNFRLATDNDGVAWLLFDRADDQSMRAIGLDGVEHAVEF